MANPWMPDEWNLTAQGDYVRAYGLRLAEKKAAEAGTTVGGKAKVAAGPAIERHWILMKKIGEGSGGGNGTSGDGPPA